MLIYETWPIERLIEYARNPRKNDHAVDRIAAAIKEYGFRVPVIAKSDGLVVDGHLRLKAAKKLGLEQIPVILADDLTEAQIKAFRLSVNKVAEYAEWDIDLLKVELGDLQGMDFDLSLTGFDPGEIKNFLAEKTDGLTDPDATPEVPVNPVTVLGDVWLMGKHRLMCGDSTSIDAVDKLMAGRKANICFTSPPYNAGSLNVKGNKTTGKKYNSFDDNQTETEFFDFLAANMTCMMASADEVFYNIGLVQDNKRAIFKIVDRFGDAFKDIIYWKKKSVAPHIQKGVINNLVEFILCFGDGKRKFASPQFSQGTYWNVIEGNNASGNEYSEIHKATFPVYLPENIISNFTARNAIVIDCFGGTGTTLIACEKTGRVNRSMELDPKYCDVIVKRWQEFTGHKATLESTGKTFEDVASNRYDWKKDSAASYDVAIAAKREELEASR